MGVIELTLLSLELVGVRGRVANVEVEQRTEVAQEGVSPTQHYFIVLFAALEYNHLHVEGNLFALGGQVVSHFNELTVVKVLDFELCVESEGIARIFVPPSSQLRHEFGLVEVDVPVRPE